MNNSLRLDKIKILQHLYNPYTDSCFTTFLFYIPKLLLAEFNTHRQLVRNVASSRAINLAMFRQDVVSNPYTPTLTSNKKGMQGGEMDEDSILQAENIITWLRAKALITHEMLENVGLHKQQANRYLEPFKVVPVIASGTEWQHFFDLRNHADADPDIAQIAYAMKQLYFSTAPYHVEDFNNRAFSSFIPLDTRATDFDVKISTARLARTSFDNFNKDDVDSNLNLFTKLANNRHSTPFEHTVVALNHPFGEFSLVNGEGVFTLPEQLKNSIFVYNDKAVYTRQYKGFYTLRAFMEDFPNLPLTYFTGQIN